MSMDFISRIIGSTYIDILVHLETHTVMNLVVGKSYVVLVYRVPAPVQWTLTSWFGKYTCHFFRVILV